MINTLILVENLSERAAYILGSIISNSKVEKMSNDVDYDSYSNVVLMLDKDKVITEEVNINGNEKRFLDHLLDLKIKLFDKKLKLAVLFEINEVSSLNDVILPLKDTVLGIQNCIFINKDVVNDAVYSAIELCEELNREEDFCKSKEELKKELELYEIIESNNILSLSSTVSDNIYSTSSEYVFIDEKIYLVSNEGELFSNIYINDKVSFSVLNICEDKVNRAIIGSARADVMELDSVEYKSLIENPKIKSILNREEVDTYIIKLLPENLKLVNI